jgi:hypothetical protein
MLRRLTGILAVPATITLTLTAFEQPAATTIRAVTTAPDQYANRPVTLTGLFRGRSSGGDRPVQPLNRSRWDFLLKSNDDALVWVSGVRPAWWDFDLDPRSVADAASGHWLEVTGTVRVRHSRQECGTPCSQVWIEASDLRPAAPAVAELPSLLRPAVYPPAVVFNDPITDERDVSRSTTVRLQFSRQMMAQTFSEHVRVSYGSPRAIAAPPIPGFSAVYQDETRSLELTFARPLDPYAIVTVELLEGITAMSGRALAPWRLTFTTGG